MQTSTNTTEAGITNIVLKLIAIILMMLFGAYDAIAKSTIDSFDDELNNDLGMPRQFLTDTMTGGSTQAKHDISNGVIHSQGEIIPPRGQLGWASTVLLLTPDGTPINAEKYTGIKINIKINQGMVSLSANSTEVTNFDYHAALISAPTDGQYHQIDIPFDTMQRAWSEQTTLDPNTINSLSIVAFSMQKAPFDIQVDDVAFY